MASTLLQLANEVAYRAGNRLDLLPEIRSFINRALQTITLDPRTEFLESITTATPATALDSLTLTGVPTDLYSVHTLYNTAKKYQLAYQSDYAYASLDPAAASSDFPVVFALIGDTLKIWPKAASVMSLLLTYRKRFADLSTDTSLLPLSLVWEEPIVLLATAFTFNHTGELERASAYTRSAISLSRLLADRQGAQLGASEVGINPLIQDIEATGS